MVPRTGMEDMEEQKFLTLPRLELRPLGLPARSQSLYRLRYPGSREFYINIFFKLRTWKSCEAKFIFNKCSTKEICEKLHYAHKSIINYVVINL
jgi:hypothetical protein